MAECTVWYKVGVLQSGIVYGKKFDKLETCCEKFSRLFFDTGNTKKNDFNASQGEDRDGLSLVTRGNEFCLELRVTIKPHSENPGPIHSMTTGPVVHCPFCESKVSIRNSGNVRLVEKYKREFLGYDEEKIEDPTPTPNQSAS